ncbi:MAG: TetR/AcrR family transcriptional regulator [Nitrospirae bacterium]|nr:TetR/AcrR family transcriptional regulator [Nitrospirota bacterium]
MEKIEKSEKTCTKQKILDAAIELISRKGYLGATTRMIASEADVAELTIFRYFKNKETLFKEVLNIYTFLPMLRELLPSLDGLPQREALRVVACSFLYTLKDRKQLVAIMFSEINRYPEKIREIYSSYVDELMNTLAGYFATLKEQDILRDINPTLASRCFLGILFSYFQREELIKGRSIPAQEIEDLVPSIVDNFLYGTIRQ